MARGDGSGWWRQSRRHHDAALKGREGKHRSRHDRAPGGIIQKDLDRLRNGAKRNRTKWALNMDQTRTAGTIYDPRDPKQVKMWRKHPDRADLDGVDTAQQQLYGIKLRAAAEVERHRELVKRAVEDARERVRKARRAAKEGKESSEAEKTAANEAIEVATAAIEKATTEVKGIIEAAKEEQDHKIRRFQGKWNAERKRRAEIVAHTVGCSMFEADALIQRAKRAGFDYDLVNWDSIQGKDLEYSEWVEKLDRDLNKETSTKGEEDNLIEWQMAKAQDEWEAYVREQEESLHTEAHRIRTWDEESAMEERDYQISFGDSRGYAENDLYESG
jgi:hypothetical protein